MMLSDRPSICLSVAIRATSYLFHCAQRVLQEPSSRCRRGRDADLWDVGCGNRYTGMQKVSGLEKNLGIF